MYFKNPNYDGDRARDADRKPSTWNHWDDDLVFVIVDDEDKNEVKENE